MVTAKDFETEGVQATAWASSGELQPTKLYRFILENWVDVFDAEPEFMPLQGIPPEFPAIVLGSSDQSLRLEVAVARINLYLRRTDIKALDIDEALSDFAKRLVEIFSVGNVQIGRLAALTSRAASVQSPASLIAAHFFRDRWLISPFNRPEALEIHSHKVFPIEEGLNVNSWMRVKTGERIGVNSGPVIVSEQDINTLQEEREVRSFGDQDVSRFFNQVTNEFDSILGLYFPNEEE
jgi:hypothetical protein